MERLAQADAWAGLRQMPEQDHTKPIARIKKRLQQEEKRSGFIFYLPRIAATAAVVAALIIGLRYFVWNEKAVSDVAVTEKQVEATPKKNDTLIAESEMANEASEALTELPTTQPKDATSQKPIAQLPAIAEVEAEALEEKEMQPDSYDIKILTKETAKPNVTVVPPPPPMPEKKADTARDFARSNAVITQEKSDVSKLQATVTAPRTIRGKITDEEGLPLIGASILVKGTQMGAVTDISGSFQLTVPVESKELIISYTGFLNQEIELGQMDSIAVQMNAGQMALDEVVVTGMGKRKSDRQAQREEKVTPKLPEPKKGFQKLEQYIERNLQYPDAAKTQGIEGVVEVEFQVLPDGNLTNFNIQKSLGYGCDEEAIRLLREGPKWRLYSLQRDTMVYSIYFELK